LHFYRTGRLEYIGIKNGNAPKSFTVRIGFVDGEKYSYKDYNLKLVLAKVEDKPNTYDITEEGEDSDTREEDENIETKVEKFEHKIKILQNSLLFCGLDTLGLDIYKIDYEIETSTAVPTTTCKLNEIYLRPIDYEPINIEYGINYCENGSELTTIVQIEYILQTYSINYCDFAEESLRDIIAANQTQEYELSYCELIPQHEIAYEFSPIEYDLDYCDTAALSNKILEDSNSNQLSYNE
jgi:hypothetical protein